MHLCCCVRLGGCESVSLFLSFSQQLVNFIFPSLHFPCCVVLCWGKLEMQLNRWRRGGGGEAPWAPHVGANLNQAGVLGRWGETSTSTRFSGESGLHAATIIALFICPAYLCVCVCVWERRMRMGGRAWWSMIKSTWIERWLQEVRCICEAQLSYIKLNTALPALFAVNI